MPYIWVCESCWQNEYLFFPDKPSSYKSQLRDSYATKTKVATLINILLDPPNALTYRTPKAGTSAPRKNPSPQGAQAGEEVPRPTSVKVDVIRLHQKDIPMYMGKMTAKDLLHLYDIDAFREDELDGYQRELYKTRAQEIAQYLERCPIAVMPGVFVSLRTDGHGFTPNSKSGDVGVLEIPHRKGAIWMIDGQHRLGGFQKAIEEGEETPTQIQETNAETLKQLLDYELPVVFVDSSEATQVVKDFLQDPNVDIDEKDIESVIFTVVNKTAKSINASLKDALLYKIHNAGIPGIPFIEKEEWRTNATKIIIGLYKDAKSPLYQKINISGSRGLKRPVRLNSFVSSMVRLVRDNPEFVELGHDKQYEYLANYWIVLGEVLREGFKYDNDYMVLKTIGVYSLNWLANDVFNWCRQEDVETTIENLRKALEPLRTFKWRKGESPLESFGGLKGVAAARKLLLLHLGEAGNIQASETLQEEEEGKAAKAVIQ